ncbi:Uncharacterised protein [uncultured archaeon]|nr:Uncharacterised protein [uncultured archaeon]
MGALKKLLLVAIGIVLVYIAAGQFGFVKPIISPVIFGQDTLGRLSEIDAQYDVGPESPMPSKNITEYEARINGLQLRTEEEKAVVQMKIEMISLGDALKGFSAEARKMNETGECVPLSRFMVAYNNAKSHAENAAALGEKAGKAKGFEYLGQDELASIRLVLGSLESAKEKYYTVC